MTRSLCALLLSMVLAGSTVAAPAAEPAAEAAAGAGQSAAEKAFYAELDKLQWVKGPTTVTVTGNAKLRIPEGYVYLDTANTDKYLELNQNLAGGTEVLVAPQDLSWSSYLSFEDDGYVKDDEKIDPAALLKSLQQGAEEGNKERERRGWPALHVVDWAVPPAYNAANQRLEWATLLESAGGRSANFSTKLLGRRGHTTVILASRPEDLAVARPALEAVLSGFEFNAGERYADWVPGDKVAEYGLAALVLGGAAAIATKKGLWAVIGGFLIAKAKLIIGGLVALGAGFRRIFKKKADVAN
ncbi:MAG: DUF2167 domain-containing protein [Steroidobacteraceae bacterium]